MSTKKEPRREKTWRIDEKNKKWTHSDYRKYLVSRIEEQKNLLSKSKTIVEKTAVLASIDLLTDRIYQLDLKTQSKKFVINGCEL